MEKTIKIILNITEEYRWYHKDERMERYRTRIKAAIEAYVGKLNKEYGKLK